MIAGACGAVRSTPEGVDAPASLASSCAELGATSADMNVRLYLDGDAMKPYSAHCSAALRTYIPLEGTNLSSYPVGGCGARAPNATVGVTTTWQMVRFDTVMHAIDTGDYMFATLTGGTHESSGNGMFEHDYLNIPFGSGRSCISGTAQTVATIDLTGTHFALAASQAWAADGFSAETEAAINPQRTKATITAKGFPVGASPCAPNADYYTVNGGTCIQLEYVP
ncbi:MAG TPA: GON domain-containing protein [Kofleriaceae bacterium]|nr:GON domain-containing protein [Kofleriaceae bacterium]